MKPFEFGEAVEVRLSGKPGWQSGYRYCAEHGPYLSTLEKIELRTLWNTDVRRPRRAAKQVMQKYWAIDLGRFIVEPVDHEFIALKPYKFIPVDPPMEMTCEVPNE